MKEETEPGVHDKAARIANSLASIGGI